MESYEIILEVQEKIENAVLDKVAPRIAQLTDAAHNSGIALQNNIITEVKTIVTGGVGEMKETIFEYKSDNEKRLDNFDLRLAKVEHSLWPKWMLAAIVSCVIGLLVLDIFILSREISLAKRDSTIEKTLQEIKKDFNQYIQK